MYTYDNSLYDIVNVVGFGFITDFVVYIFSHDIVNFGFVTDFIGVIFYFYSITIDDIVYVIDCGFVKVKDFNPEKGLQTLESFPVSRANAQQRKGRAGRYSVYTEINLPLHSQKHGHFFLVKKNSVKD